MLFFFKHSAHESVQCPCVSLHHKKIHFVKDAWEDAIAIVPCHNCDFHSNVAHASSNTLTIVILGNDVEVWCRITHYCPTLSEQKNKFWQQNQK